ncbi:MAG: hypothetical protein IJ037_11825, partial [Clostridia bacterium]|nr:hypothetical protein [Clostridia bacterium]
GEIILHGDGNRPSLTAGGTAGAHLTGKMRKIIGNQKVVCFFHLGVVSFFGGNFFEKSCPQTPFKKL